MRSNASLGRKTYQYSKMVFGPEKAFCMTAFYEIKYINMTPQRQCRRKNDVDLLSKPCIFRPYTLLQYDPEITGSHTHGFFSWDFVQNDVYIFCLPSTRYLEANHKAYTKNDHYIFHKLQQGTEYVFDIVCTVHHTIICI